MLKFLGRLILAVFFLVLAAGSIRWIRMDLPPRLAVFHWNTPFVLGFLLLPPFYFLIRGRFRLWETLEHEFTHALFATLLFKKLNRLDAGNGRGFLEYEGGRSLIITLAPYFFPTLALLPVLSGLMTMFGVMGWLGYGFNLFNLVATILMIGLGVDYGIFMVYRLFRDLEPSAEKAVLVSALTTLSGFGVLVLARHPALHSIGLTILLGVCGALPTVIWIVPALAAFRNPSKKRKTPSLREVKS
jgi:hypothetical protein